MARVKGGYVTRRWHKKIFKLTKGQWGTRGRLFRRSNEAMLKLFAKLFDGWSGSL